MEIIALIISVSSFLLSVYTIVSAKIKAVEKYDIDIVDYMVYDNTSTQFLVCVSNKSSEPLSILSISYNGIICELEPKKIKNNPPDWNFQSTPRFPLCIAAHGCQYAYLEFVDRIHPHKSLCRETTVNFQIRSTRKTVHKKISLGEPSHYLHTKN